MIPRTRDQRIEFKNSIIRQNSNLPKPEENPNIYISQMNEELQKPKFIRKYTYMQHSETFSNKEFEELINEYYINIQEKETNYKNLLKSSIIIPLDHTKTESAIEVFANSKGIVISQMQPKQPSLLNIIRHC